MKYTLNGVSHFDFFENLEKVVFDIIGLLESENVGLIEFKEQSNRLITQAEEYISDSILPLPTEILRLLDKNGNTIFDYTFSEYSFKREGEIVNEIEKIDRFGKTLRDVIGYLKMIDTLYDADKITLIETMADKNDFILSKLNSVFGDENYSIEQILKFNDIKYRENETREIAEDLHKRGYLILNDRSGNSDRVKISVKGAAFIERKLRKKGPVKERNELDKKIDMVIDHLTKLGYGQEILFNEIEELRELQHKLSKKSWTQLLKGRLIDLGLEQLISIEVAKSVYEYLTSDNFRLLK
jgi:predicted transcriptional regulator